MLCRDNMNICKWPSILIVFFVCFACDKPLPTLTGIDAHRWADDRNGCKEDRTSMRDTIDTQKEKLLALDEMQIVRLLGRPDRNELYSGKQKFYYYFIEPSPDCGARDSTAERLAIRFNAVGLAKEVAIIRSEW